MEYSTLDKLGVRVSRLGFGCMRFPLTAEGKIDEPRAAAMLDTAYKAGVTYYDTAYFYHQHTGEAFLGRAMKRYPRDTFYLATKMPMSIVESLDHAKEIFEGQLAALQTDYVDFTCFTASTASAGSRRRRWALSISCWRCRKRGASATSVSRSTVRMKSLKRF